MSEVWYEIGSVFRDIAIGVLAGAVVLSPTNPTYWQYAVVGVFILALGLILQLLNKKDKI